MSDPQAISGTRRAIKEMSDGTIRVQIDIDPRFRSTFWALFPNIDMPVALAPLEANFEQRDNTAKGNNTAKGGALAVLAGRLCADERFHEFVASEYGVIWRVGHAADDIAQWMREQCDIESRAELDHNEAAAEAFHRIIRGPWQKCCQQRGWK
ncbi:hypothetical protein QZM15_16335 [Burkholderia sp. AU44665]|uniref:hypothetical protein n=1 Tax=Burkholderia sp. AU44665 TaxID=3059203 RepID=UPI00265F0172|nr:hypothetical protein [Burkholderia sp. AU44665]MDN7700039.1 hypothetical protein [Burkholderia sp. AU44665]